MAIYRAWEDIYRINNMRITTVSGSEIIRNIFSNGFNNVEVLVQILAENEYGELITGIPVYAIWENGGLLTSELGTMLLRGDYPTRNAWFYNTYSDVWTVEPPYNVLQKAQEVAVEDPANEPYRKSLTANLSEYDGVTDLSEKIALSYENDPSFVGPLAYAPEEYVAQNEQRDYPPGINQGGAFDTISTQVGPLPAYDQYSGADIQNYYAPESESTENKEQPGFQPSIDEETWSSAPFYVRRGPAASEVLQVSAFVNLTHPSAPRRFYSTARNAASGIHNYISIAAHLPIDYSDAKNVIIPPEYSILPIIASESLGWTARFASSGPYWAHYNGKADYAYIDLTPRIGGYFSVARITFRMYISDAEVNTSTVSWGGVAEPGFSGIKNNPVESRPISVMSNGVTTNLFYFPNPDPSVFTIIRVSGAIFYWYGSYTYRFSPYINLYYNRAPSQNPARLIRVKFTIYEGVLYHNNWKNVYGSPVTMFLQDRYGNYGEFQFGFSLDNNFFDVPGAV